MSRSTLAAGNRFNAGGTTESHEKMNQMEQVVVFIVVGFAMVLFIGVFIVFVCRCSKRCPTYRYSLALFDQPPRRRGMGSIPAFVGLPLPSMTQSPDKRRTTTTAPLICPHLPPYSEEWTTTTEADPRSSETPPPEYAFVSELVPLSRPPSYQSMHEEDDDKPNSRRFVSYERY